MLNPNMNQKINKLSDAIIIKWKQSVQSKNEVWKMIKEGIFLFYNNYYSRCL